MQKKTGGWAAGWTFLSVLALALLVYSQIWAFAWDEGFHLLTAQLIKAGKTPYIDFLFPQPPLNAYWVAGWMRVFGESWRTAQALSALETSAAIALTADYLLRRFPAAGWRKAGALTAVLLFGLNTMVVEFGTEGQAYGISLLLIVLAFRFGIRAAANSGWLVSFAAGFCAAAAAGSTLLTAPVAPVLLLWIMVYHETGDRWVKFVAFGIGMLIPWIPVIILFSRAPAVVWFGLAGYNILYRRNGWGDPAEHDIGVMLAWIDSAQALLLVVLALGALLHLAKESNWGRHIRGEFYLCAWLAIAETVHLSFGRPTFERYYLLTVPFLAILGAAGLYAIASRIGGGPNWALASVALIMTLGLGKALYEEQGAFAWSDLEEIARKVEEVTPRDGTLLADEHIYFLTRRRPPSGMELDYSHRLLIPAALAEQLHVVLRPELNRRIRAGAYNTIATCQPEKADAIGIPQLYSQKEEIADCSVFWGFKR